MGVATVSGAKSASVFLLLCVKTSTNSYRQVIIDFSKIGAKKLGKAVVKKRDGTSLYAQMPQHKVYASAEMCAVIVQIALQGPFRNQQALAET